MKHLKRCKRRY